jgi:hypothetical protein
MLRRKVDDALLRRELNSISRAFHVENLYLLDLYA